MLNDEEVLGSVACGDRAAAIYQHMPDLMAVCVCTLLLPALAGLFSCEAIGATAVVAVCCGGRLHPGLA